MNNPELTVLDLFCGCGGLSLGFQKAGYHVLLGIDVWKDALVTYQKNHKNSKTLCADLSSLSAKEVENEISGKKIDIIIGGPPCQGFSVAGKRIVEDDRNKLYKSFVRMVEYFKPRAFVMENVPNILTIGQGIIRDSIMSDFQSLGYHVENKVLTASNYGVPQNRRRAVFIGLLDGSFDFKIPEVEKKVTCSEALSDLPEDSIPDGDSYPEQPASMYQKVMRMNSNGVYNHLITEHDQKTKSVIAMVPDGGNYLDLPEDMQHIRNVHIAWTRLNSQKPSITIDTGHRHHFHYKYNRVPTVRESARIQSFPDDFVFLGSKTSQYKQVGNAVPPIMAQAIAEYLKGYLTPNEDLKELPKSEVSSPSLELNKPENNRKRPMAKETTYYKVPDLNWHRIHFVRPRFKSNIENVLLYMANECCRIPDSPCEEYSKKYFNAIRMFPGNIDMAEKTLHNWRTEIPALFAFYTEDKDANITRTSKMAKFLHENQDLTQFLRLFLFSFQFPGGHMKPQDLQDIIKKGIRFKPAQMIIKVLMAGNVILSKSNSLKEMSISAEEATYCIFNDTRVTTGKIGPEIIAQTILDNRKNKLKYYNPKDSNVLSLTGSARTKGDVIRYAGDILDYMSIANLLIENHGYFSLKGNEKAAIDSFANDHTFFMGYEKLYGKKNITNSMLSAVEPHWFDYVNQSMRPDLFKTDIRTLFEGSTEIELVIGDRLNDVVSNVDRTTKDIGNLGEAIICGHEKMRLKINGYNDFIRLVQIVDTPAYHPGYDIHSYEADGTTDIRYIEVKTTVSKKVINMYGFHMSSHEWSVAGTIKEHYYVYRLMLSENRMTLLVLRDPVRLYKTDVIEAEARDGMEISFTPNTFEPTEILKWQN